jgi:ribonuclease HI
VPFYVVTAPEPGIYETWAECKAATQGRKNARYMKVQTAEEAQSILDGGVFLDPGLHAFTDANASGGVGIVLVMGGTPSSSPPEVLKEIPTTVAKILKETQIPGLEAEVAVAAAIRDLANIFAEMVALYAAIREVPTGSSLTIVYDYLGVDRFMSGEWDSKDEPIRRVVDASRRLAEEKSLHLSYRHQPGHSSSWAGRHDYARFNARADELATEAAES